MTSSVDNPLSERPILQRCWECDRRLEIKNTGLSRATSGWKQALSQHSMKRKQICFLLTRYRGFKDLESKVAQQLDYR